MPWYLDGMEKFLISHEKWLWKDFELMNEAIRIHDDLTKKSIKEGSDEYWHKLELELFKRKKNSLMKYYTYQ